MLKLCKRTWRTSCVCQLFFVERVLQAWNCGKHVAHASKKANPLMWPSNPRLQANCKCKGTWPLGTTKHASSHGKWFWLGAQLPARICLPGLHVVKKWSHKLAPISWIGQLTQWWAWWPFWPSCPKFQHLGWFVNLYALCMRIWLPLGHPHLGFLWLKRHSYTKSEPGTTVSFHGQCKLMGSSIHDEKAKVQEHSGVCFGSTDVLWLF